MAIDGRKVGETTQDESRGELKVRELRLVASDGATHTTHKSGALQHPRIKAAHSLAGVEVTEFEATLPIEIYGELFKDER